MHAVRARARAAVLGAFVADAATMPLHWIYDVAQIKQLVGDGAPTFFHPPSCPFYDYPLGQFSPYGDEMFPLLQSVVERGGVDPAALTQDLYAAFKAYPGRLNQASKDLVANVDAGKTYPHAGASNDQAHCLVKAPIVVAAYAGTALLAQKMEEAVRCHQDDDDAVEFGVAAARILERVVLGDSVASALLWARSSRSGLGARAVHALLQAGALDKTTPLPAAVLQFGQSCHLPGAFEGPLFVMDMQPRRNYTSAVRDNVLAGGDNCSRAAFLAACFAAQDGMAAIPEEWIAQTARYSEVAALVERLVYEDEPEGVVTEESMASNFIKE